MLLTNKQIYIINTVVNKKWRWVVDRVVVETCANHCSRLQPSSLPLHVSFFQISAIKFFPFFHHCIKMKERERYQDERRGRERERYQEERRGRDWKSRSKRLLSLIQSSLTATKYSKENILLCFEWAKEISSSFPSSFLLYNKGGRNDLFFFLWSSLSLPSFWLKKWMIDWRNAKENLIKISFLLLVTMKRKGRD